MYIINAAPLKKIPRPLAQYLSYFTSQKLESGSLVSIQLRKKEFSAIVLSKEEIKFKKMEIKKADFQLKPVLKIIEKRPILSESQINLAKWISSYYFASIGKTLSLFLPQNAIKKIAKGKMDELFFEAAKQNPPQPPSSRQLQKLIVAPPDFLPEKEIKKTFKEGKQVLFLIPEKNKKEFWQKKIEKVGNGKIAVGTRSLLFSPLLNLGLIILSEEENKNYKSETEPRYNAKKVAEKLAEILKIKLILLSSSPSVETYHQAKKKEYKSAKYNTQYPISDIQIIDIKKIKPWRPISPELSKVIKEKLFKKEKTVLFLNRKGSGTSILCQDCGWIKKCPKCEMPMTYDKKQAAESKRQAKLICHHCGFKDAVPEYCKKCLSWKLIALGAGTEKAESELKKEFQEAKILRLDKETAPAADAQKKIIKEFLDGEGDILIATSLLFQYLPSPIISRWRKKIKLAGVISIDSFLSLPDFRVEEEGAKIIKKLLFFRPEKFILQTFWPKSKALVWIKKPEEYNYFLEKTLEERKEYFYPPFSQLIKLDFSHKNKKKAEIESYELKRKLDNKILNIKCQVGDILILGPAPRFVPKFKEQYRWTILIKLKTGKPEIKNQILETISPNWKIDVDPITTL